MNAKLLKLIYLAILSLNLTACGTIISIVENDYSPYAGVAKDFHTIQDGSLIGVFAVVDLPLSFVLDTLMLPITLSQ